MLFLIIVWFPYVIIILFFVYSFLISRDFSCMPSCGCLGCSGNFTSRDSMGKTTWRLLHQLKAIRQSKWDIQCRALFWSSRGSSCFLVNSWVHANIPFNGISLTPAEYKSLRRLNVQQSPKPNLPNKKRTCVVSVCYVIRVVVYFRGLSWFKLTVRMSCNQYEKDRINVL